MGKQTFGVSGKKNYKGGSYNKGGTQYIGWDNGKVRAEQWKFTTGQWPVTQISFTIKTEKKQGSDIKIRCGIATKSSSYTNSSGSSSGYACNKGKTTTITKSLSPNTTYYITFFPGVSKSTFGLLEAKSLTSITAQVNNRGKCGEPTEITLEPVIQTPEQYSTLSWSGATDGLNNPIASYEILRSDTEAGEYTSIGSTLDAQTTTYEVQAPEQVLTSYYYKVRANGTYGYNSDLSDFVQLTANRAPEAPEIVNVSRYTVPSAGLDVAFTVNPGTSYKTDPPTLWYSTSPSGDKIQFISPLTIFVDTATTFYFYTYDGTDYSQPVSQAIAVNTKPIINTVTATPITYRALGGDGQGDNQLGYARAITPVITTNKNCNVRVFLEYYILPSGAEEDLEWDDYQVQARSEPILECGTSETIGSCNIHQWVTKDWHGETTIHWRLCFILNDGIEDSDPAYYPHGETLAENNEYYALAHAPSVTAKYNRHDTSDISGTVQNQIWKNVRIVVPYDGSMDEAFASAVADKEYQANCVLNVDSETPHDYYYIDITIPGADSIPGGTQIKINAGLKSQNITKNIEEVIATETKAPSVLSALAQSPEVIKPFTESGNFDIIATWPFAGYVDLETGLPAYNCSTTATDVLKLVYSSSGEGDGANRVIKTLTWTKNGSDLKTTLDRANVYEWNGSLGYTTYAGEQLYYCRLEITNLFGKRYSTPWLSSKFDFDENAVDLEISNIKYSTNYNPEVDPDPESATWTDLENNAIQEGVYLRFFCEFGLYTSDKVTVTLLAGSATFTERDILKVNYNSDELARATGKQPASNQKDYIYRVEEISDSNDRTWKLKVTNNEGDAVSDNNHSKLTPVTKQCAPDIEFTQCLVSKTYRIDYTFTINDDGGSNSLQYCLCDADTTTITPINPLASVSTGTTTGYYEIRTTPPPTWNSKKISIKIVSTVTGLITNVKEYYSNVIIAYQVTPTVAYRLNAIGINANDPEPDAAVDIHQAGSNSKVFIQGQDSNNIATRFEIDVTTGLIKFYKGNSATPISTLDFINKIWT